MHVLLTVNLQRPGATLVNMKVASKVYIVDLPA